MRNGRVPTDPREAAALYITLDLSPIALAARSKAPIDPGWPHSRLTADALDEHFPPGRIRNIGVLNGTASAGIVDVDIDAPEARLAASSLLPATGWVFGHRSAPRSHWLYRIGQVLDTAQEAYSDLDGTVLVELRGDGGQSMVPPSIHPSGEHVTWDSFGEPADVTLDDLRRAVRELAAAALLARHWPAKGSRDAAALALTGGLTRAGWDAERIGRFVEAVAVAAGDDEPRMRRGKARQTARKVEDGRKTTGWPTLAELMGKDGPAVVERVQEWLGLVRESKQTEAPWLPPIPLNELPPVLPFPAEVFPDQLRRVVEEGALALACPPDYLAVPLLGACAIAVGASRALAVKTSHVQRCSLYAAVVGPPGSTKTPAQDLMVAPLHTIGRHLREQWEEQMKTYEEEQEEYEADKKRRRSKTKPETSTEEDKPIPKPERPVLKRVTASDATAECMALILKENPRGVGLVNDEQTAWVARMDQYKAGGQGADRQFYLSCWSGVQTEIDRKGKHEQGPIVIPRPFLCVFGGLTPGRLPTLRGDTRGGQAEDDGHLDRILFSYPPDPPVSEETWMELDPKTMEGLSEVYDKLRDLAMEPIMDGAVLRGWRSRIVRLSKAGRQAWQRFTQQHAAEVNAEDFPPHLRGPWSKLKGYCVRLALLLHFVRYACDETQEEDVDGESMERAVRLVEYFKSHARKVYCVIENDRRTADAAHVLRWLAARPELVNFSRRDVHQGLRHHHRFQNPDNLDQPLDLLARHGYIRPAGQHESGRRAGRPPTDRFERNPLWDGTQNTQYPQNHGSDAENGQANGSFEHFEDIEDNPPSVRTKDAGIVDMEIP